jgi:hypothetical protein
MTLNLPLTTPVKQQPAGHTSQPRALTLWPTNSQVLGVTTLDLPCYNRKATTHRAYHSTKSYNPLVYHCAKCYNIGLTIYQLSSSHTSFFQPISHSTSQSHYHIISCHSNHQSNFMLFNPKQFQVYQYKLIITLLNPIFHNFKHIYFYQQFQ